jgi:IS5 family transposase
MHFDGWDQERGVAKNEPAAKAKGLKRVCIPNRSTKSAAQRREQKKRWFRNGQKWRTGCEGRISVVKRRHGLSRCRRDGRRVLPFRCLPTTSA